MLFEKLFRILVIGGATAVAISPMGCATTNQGAQQKTEQAKSEDANKDKQAAPAQKSAVHWGGARVW